MARLQDYPLVITGSSWNEWVLRQHGVDHVRTILQGVDPSLFHPATRAGVLPGRWFVFSSGKLEYRKGQDIVLAAFRVFSERHPEALLVTAWHNPWPALARSFAADGRAVPPPPDPDGGIDVPAWAAANGIKPERLIDLGAVPNTSMPSILREMDVAVFPSRCEGGTNLMAMECMACGVPVVLSRNTGHLDLIGEDNCYPLLDQQPLRPGGEVADAPPGPAESSVEELVETLEAVWRNRAEAARRGARAADRMRGFTWAHSAEAMKRVVLDHS